MKKVLTITLLCIFASVVLFGAFNAIHSSSVDSAKLKKAWDQSEEAIKTANDRMDEIRLARRGYETERDTLQGDAPSTVLGMIGRGFSVALNIFFNSSKGVRLIELDALIMYTWIQADILNVELSTLDATRDTALATYNASGSHNAEAKYDPDYETIPIVSVPCPNMCGATFTSTDAGGLRNLRDYMETAHRDRCGTSSSTPPGCGKGYWTCNGRYESGTDEHRERTCKNLGKKWNSTTRQYEVVTCYMSYRECQNSGGKCFDGKVAGRVEHRDNVSSQNSYFETTGGPSETPTSSYHACGVHEDWQSGDHSAAGCGTSGHYNCDGSDHSLQASCTLTDSNGNYCTVSSFYACQSHTCQYPTAPEPEPTPAPTPEPTETCARKACGQTVSDRLDHRIDCSNCGGHYWTCVSGAIHNHTTTFTCRRSGCGVTFTRCSNGTCTSDSGTHNYHWAQ